jgi:hypothetical protein
MTWMISFSHISVMLCHSYILHNSISHCLVWVTMSWNFYLFSTNYFLTAASYCAGRRLPCSARVPEWMRLIAGAATWSTGMQLCMACVGPVRPLSSSCWWSPVATLFRMLLAQVRHQFLDMWLCLPVNAIYLLLAGLPRSILVCTSFFIQVDSSCWCSPIL